MKRLYLTPDGRRVILHFNSWLARAVVGFGGVNNCVTLSARHIFVSRDWITARTLAHEIGHVLQAQRLGWRYLPWIAYCFVRYGYAQSPAELDADAYMHANAARFIALGNIPGWVV